MHMRIFIHAIKHKGLVRTCRRSLRPAAWPCGPPRRLGSGCGSIHRRPPAARCGGLLLHNAACAPVALRQPACARWLRRHSQPPGLTRRPLRARARRHSQRSPPAYGKRALHRPARSASPKLTPCDALPAGANAPSALAPLPSQHEAAYLRQRHRPRHGATSYARRFAGASQ